MRKFYKCDLCGNMIGIIKEGGGQIVCCGQPMTEIVANTTDAAQEKHVPVITVNGKKVSIKVGDVEHPMTEKHLIEWIYLETKEGGQRKALSADDAPVAEFVLTEDDEPVAAYAYCNLHGLWKACI